MIVSCEGSWATKRRATGNQVFYFLGLKKSTATISCAMTNILPAITFILAVPFGLEVLGIKRRTGQVKVLGTLVCVGGAMLLSFYHGHTIGIGQSSIRWKYADTITKHNATSASSNGSFFLGPLLLLVGNVSWAIWFILQAKASKTFAAPYTSTALMCFMASIYCSVIAACSNHKLSAWSLSSRIRTIASLYAYSPPCYWSLWLYSAGCYLRRNSTSERSLLIVLGLYTVLWGNNKEMNERNNEDGDDAGVQKDNLELPQVVHFNGNCPAKDDKV
ncbi:hypothetical protein Ancab_000553 [Ancistrocladus abbreviatus]